MTQNYKFPLSYAKLSYIPQNEPFICMFSGGKDCGLALSIMIENNNLQGLTHCVYVDNGVSLFHYQSQKNVIIQAEAIGVPIEIMNYSALENWPKLIRKYEEFAQQGVKSVVYGDMFLEDHAKLQCNMCMSAGLMPRMPLWHMAQENIIKEIIARKLKCIITAIRSPLLSDSWLGQILDERAFEHFISLGIDPLGENGEYHTTLVDANFFEKSLNYELSSKTKEINDIRTINIKLSIA